MPSPNAAATIAIDTTIFTGINEAETRLLDAIADLPVSVSRTSGREKKIEVGGIVRPSLIQLVLCHPSLARALDSRELNLCGVGLSEPLDLSFSRIAYPLTWERWTVCAPIQMHHARFAHLKLEGGSYQSIAANGLVVDTDLVLENARFRGRLSIERARIGGAVRLNRSRFLCPADMAVNAAGAWLTGSLDMREARVVGSFELPQAHIGGNVVCNDSTFRNPLRKPSRATAMPTPGDTARRAHPGRGPCRLTVETGAPGAPSPMKGHRFKGARLTRVGSPGSRWCGRAACRPPRSSIAPPGVAIDADFMQVDGALRLENVRTHGEIRMLNLKCGTDISFSEADLRNPAGDALSLDQIRVMGAVFLREASFKGSVRIAGAHVGLDLDLSGARLIGPRPDQKTRDSEDGGAVADSARSSPSAALQGAGAAGSGAGTVYPSPPEDEPEALLANRARIRGNVYLSEGFSSLGPISLKGAHVAGNVVCEDARLMLHHPTPAAEKSGKRALTLETGTVQGTVHVENITTNGIFDCSSVRIGRNLKIKNVTYAEGARTGYLLQNARVDLEFSLTGSRALPGTKLVLSHGRFGRIRHGHNSWPCPGQMKLDGCEYNNIDFDESDRTQRDRATLPIWKSLLNFATAWWPDDSVARDWLHRQDQSNFDPQPYEQLSTVRRREGESDATQISIDMERARQGQTRDWARRLAGAVTGVFLQYGYSTRRVWAISLLWVAFAAFVFGQGKRAGVLAVSEPTVFMEKGYTDPTVEPPAYPRFFAVTYSLDSFLPIIDLHQESHWLPDAKRACRLETGTRVPSCGWLFNGFFWFHIIMGWWASTLIALALTGAVRRHRG